MNEKRTKKATKKNKLYTVDEVTSKKVTKEFVHDYFKEHQELINAVLNRKDFCNVKTKR